MLDKLGLSFAFLSLLMGTFLLYDAVSRSDPNQMAMVIGGAVFFALGLVTISLIARDWWEWRKRHKNARRFVSN
jgi:hypothetical protein